MLCAVAIGAIIVYSIARRSTTSREHDMRSALSLIDRTTLEGLERLSANTLDTSHLSGDILPPTNTWFSGLALQAEPKPVFSMPNSFLARSNGFEFGLPKVSSTENEILGPHRADMIATVDASSSYKVVRYDELTVTLTYFNGDNPLIDLTLAAGLPYVFMKAHRDVELTITGGAVEKVDEQQLQYRQDDTIYGLWSDGNLSEARVQMQKGQKLTMFSSPSADDFNALSSHTAAHVTGTDTVAYQKNRNSFETKLAYNTDTDKPTVLVRLPHQAQDSTSDLVYKSIYGDLSAIIAKEIVYDTPAIEIRPSLSLSDLSDEEKSQLRSTLAFDIASDTEIKQDSYFGGKQLQRMAELLDIARQLGETKQAKMAQKKLKGWLISWLDNKNGVRITYDDVARSIVLRPGSFGSDTEMNDHHFHYGYFVYAAAILARYDESFADQYKSKINLLVADIANYHHNELPLRRSFDAYAGHSWASGTSPFADGNNQESVSEAINAWTGVALWASETNNDALEEQAAWMLAHEADAARRYYLEPDLSAAYLKQYSAPLVSLNWGGKRGYNTFFSDEANAKLAIELLPLSPTWLQALRAFPLSESIFKGTSFGGQYGDVIEMAHPSKLSTDRSDAEPLDDGNSRTYYKAVLFSK